MAELFTANPQMFENVNLHQLPEDLLFGLSRKQLSWSNKNDE